MRATIPGLHRPVSRFVSTSLAAFPASRRPGAGAGRAACCAECLASKRARYVRLAAIDPTDRSQVARIAREGPGPDDGLFVRAVFARILREDTG
jgi:hypothetical protein